jgi:hypothetical protein
MVFKTGKGSGASLDSPETLFNDLRSRQVKGLLSHQADILREYVQGAETKPDVAIQMPTGSGKTLVGLLIAEWRRRKLGGSAIYLCPTNQLVHQVADQANGRYGIRVLAFTGAKADYDPAAKAAYQAAEAVAVTSYSSLFNVKPFFDAPRTIVLDDAHSAENYIASAWSVRIERVEHKSIFEAVVAVLHPYLTATDLRKLTGKPADRWDISWVEKLPTPALLEIADDLASVLDTYTAGTDLRYSWSWLRHHLHACHLYLGAYDILVRPLIPPTFSHSAFSRADQRIYMSATLGEGGDLERVTGRKVIYRLTGPRSWEQQSIGRRFFVFAERALDRIAAQQLYIDLIKISGRALFLVADERSAQGLREWLEKVLKHKLFTARDIEQSKQVFTKTKNAVAIAANRYDGIDLAEDECRLLLVEGVPGAVNLQERFLVSRMGSARVLDDRILTRVVQAFGRCTRSSTDYAAVIICGEELHKYLLRTDRRQFFHPELQAELQFGIDQSRDSNRDNFTENVRLFLSQGAEWRAADAEIVDLRSRLTRTALPGSEQLRKAVAWEVGYSQSLWAGNYDMALDDAKSVLGQLGGDELKGYRAFWYYLAGSAAWLAASAGQTAMENTARELFDNARKATTGVRWLYDLAKQSSSSVQEEPLVDSRVLALVERIEERLLSLGTLNNKRYDELEQQIRAGLSDEKADVFEPAQERLGWLLGYESGRSTDQGAPDPWWAADDTFCLVFEDYTEAQQSSAVSVTKARQVASHPRWVVDRLKLAPSAVVVPVLITDACCMAREAVPHLREVYVWRLTAFREWASNALHVVRQLRSTFTEPGDLAWRADAASALVAANIAPSTLTTLVTTGSRAADVLRAATGA